MSKHNYSQYSDKKNKKQFNEPVFEEHVDAEVAADPAVDVTESVALVNPIEGIDAVVEAVKPVTQPAHKEGVVANCGKLNVRANPNTNAAVVCVLNANAKVGINVKKSNKEWFYVLIEDGIEGYCMKQYIDANL